MPNKSGPSWWMRAESPGTLPKLAKKKKETAGRAGPSVPRRPEGASTDDDGSCRAGPTQHKREKGAPAPPVA